MQKYKPLPKSVDTFKHLVEVVVDQANKTALNKWEKLSASDKKRYKRPSLVIGLALDVTWRPNVSNTHSCPFNGKTNWGGRDKDAPRGYPGWSGKVWMRHAASYDGFVSDVFRGTVINTGTGGAGGHDGPWRTVSAAYYSHNKHLYNDYNCKIICEDIYKIEKDIFEEPRLYQYGVEIFDADIPGIAEYNEFEYAEHYFSTGQKRPGANKTVIWTDPATLESDKEFIEFTKTCSRCNPGTRTLTGHLDPKGNT